MPAPARPRILLVDDYADATEVWALYLDSFGFEIATASDGHEAIAYALAHRPDLVVLDLNLPGCSGIDVARALRADSSVQHLPLIAVTGSSDRRVLDSARELFQAVVAKPCEPGVLVATIRRLLNPSE